MSGGSEEAVVVKGLRQRLEYQCRPEMAVVAGGRPSSTSETSQRTSTTQLSGLIQLPVPSTPLATGALASSFWQKLWLTCS